MPEKCVDPTAPIKKCRVCNADVYTCERNAPINSRDYRCPVHPGGVETDDGWFCLGACYDMFYKK